MKIAIAGYGAEGQSSYRYYTEKGDDVTIVTNRVSEQYPIPEGAKAIVGDDAFEQLQAFDIVLRTPPMRPESIVTNGIVWSQTNEFFAKCPAPIIGVTGTKGKGTTASLIASILRAAGKTVHLVGNIGEPALTALPTIQSSDIVVYELSSFQLWDAKKSPHIAVVLMIEPDHLDVHTDMEDYLAAKANIAKYQVDGDTIVYNRNNRHSAFIAESSQNPSITKIPYPFDISDVSASLQLPGAHNIENASAAIAAVREYVTDPAIIKQGLAAFTGLPHRLKFVAEKAGVNYYDDSIATTPGSAIAAMNSFHEPKVLILGGSDKGADYQAVVDTAKATGTTVLAIGQTGQRIYQLCQMAGVAAEYEAGTMPEVVAHAAQLATQGSVVLLSPASASFDQYKSYSDRGDQFIAAVEGL